jgi:hypothetical protein
LMYSGIPSIIESTRGRSSSSAVEITDRTARAMPNFVGRYYFSQELFIEFGS